MTSRASSSSTAATQTLILIVVPRTLAPLAAVVAHPSTALSCCVPPLSYDSLGEFDRAIADYTHALELDMAANAKSGGAQRQRGGGLAE